MQARWIRKRPRADVALGHKQLPADSRAVIRNCAAIVVQINCGWLDVLINAEKIVRIEFALNSGKAFVLVSICCSDPVLALFFEIIDVDGARRMRLHGVKELLDPGNCLAGFALSFPVGMDPILEAGAAKTERVIVASR